MKGGGAIELNNSDHAMLKVLLEGTARKGEWRSILFKGEAYSSELHLFNLTVLDIRINGCCVWLGGAAQLSEDEGGAAEGPAPRERALEPHGGHQHAYDRARGP